ncbi:MAG: hypothetical protein ACYC6A_15160 [Armatimonadota bacterium]
MSALLTRGFTLARLCFVAVLVALLASICTPFFLQDKGGNSSAVQEIARRKNPRRIKKMAPPGSVIAKRKRIRKSTEFTTS